MATLPNHEELLAQLRGSTLTVPDFSPILSKWPSKVNQNYQQIKEDAESYIDSLNLSNQKLKRYKDADFALGASYCWPNAKIGELRVLAYLAVWIFAWDDEMDDVGGRHTHNLESGRKFCADTALFVQYHLGLEAGSEPVVDDPLINSSRIIWEHVRDAYSQEQSQLVLAEIRYYLDNVSREHQTRLSDTIPSLKEYRGIRNGTSGVGIALSLTEYAYCLREARFIKQVDPLIEKMWNDCNTIIFITNDILSLPKETVSGMTSNMVSVLTAESGDLQMAVSEAYKMIQDVIDQFEQAATEILSGTGHRSISNKEMQIIVNGIRDTWVGNLYWHFESARYGYQAINKHAGSFKITL